MKPQKQSAFTLIEIMIVVAIIGLLATIAVPNFWQAIQEARAKACLMNRKNIDAAKFRWMLASGQSDEATPSDQDLFGPSAYIEHKPECLSGGNYALNRVRERCSCSVPKHVD